MVTVLARTGIFLIWAQQVKGTALAWQHDTISFRRSQLQEVSRSAPTPHITWVTGCPLCCTLPPGSTETIAMNTAADNFEGQCPWRFPQSTGTVETTRLWRMGYSGTSLSAPAGWPWCGTTRRDVLWWNKPPPRPQYSGHGPAGCRRCLLHSESSRTSGTTKTS